MYPLRICLLSCFILWSDWLFGQAFIEHRRFTNRDGLAGNTVYRCMEDHQGYLWICTGSGISRFDGKQFQNFTTEHGLPDNEVLQVMVDRDDRVWVSCFGKSAAYFDRVKNRFINEQEDTLLRLPKISSYNNLSARSEGGVEYNSSYYTAIFNGKNKIVFQDDLQKDTLCHHWELDQHHLLRVTFQKSKLNKTQNEYQTYQVVNGFTDQSPSPILFSGHYAALFYDNKVIYNLDQPGKQIVRIRLNAAFEKQSIDTFFMHEDAYRLFLGKHYLFTNTSSGAAEVYDLTTKKMVYRIQGDFMVNAVYEDSHNNLWVSTRNNGLLFYSKSSIQPYRLHETGKQPIYSILFQQNETLQVGLQNNEVWSLNGGVQRHPLAANNHFGYVYSLLESQHKVYAFGENAATVNFSPNLHIRQHKIMPLKYKCAQQLNDSLILLGGYNRLDKLNTLNDSISVCLHSLRVNACAALDETAIWLGTLDGLYLMRPNCTPERISSQEEILKERITSMCFAYDSTLWVATASKGIYAIKQQRVVFQMNHADGLLSNQVNKIYADSKNQIWLSLPNAVSVLRQRVAGSKPKIQNFTEADGLNDGDVYCFYERKDSMYLGTEAGILSLPLSLEISLFDIPVSIHRLLINQQDTTLLSEYNLRYNQRSLSLFVGGIDIWGHFHHTEYRLHPDDPWISLEGNSLNLNLSSGQHRLELRAVDINGHASHIIKTIQFNVATPFWRSGWFWIPLLILSQLLIAYAIYQRIQRKQKLRQQAYEQQMRMATLEQQAYTSLLNPHFIFNSLNGIQHFLYSSKKDLAENYISRLTKLIRQSFELSQKTFVSLDDEIAHINQYVFLEQQRYETAFDFVIRVDPQIDTEEVMIPAMLLQPLVENAIVHGQLQDNPKGLLEVIIENKDDGIRYTIKDNGVGKDDAKRNKTHHSLGTQLIAKRLHSLGLLCGQAIQLNYSEPFSDELFKGYEVSFQLPNELFETWKKNKH